MNVREIIERLQRCNPDAEVTILLPAGDGFEHAVGIDKLETLYSTEAHDNNLAPDCIHFAPEAIETDLQLQLTSALATLVDAVTSNAPADFLEAAARDGIQALKAATGKTWDELNDPKYFTWGKTK